MFDSRSSFATLARRFGVADSPKPQQAILASMRVELAGFGSIARPTAEMLYGLGARTFTLIDPKVYHARSTASQCHAIEVGRKKVDVGRERLQDAQVATYACDIDSVPDGTIDRETVIIASFDNRRADIAANRRAVRMGARLLKMNIEPSVPTVALRVYDYRGPVRMCAECQFSDRHYATQRHPKSCDGPGPGRRTNSPRWLSQMAGYLGALVVCELTHPESMHRWASHEWQYQVKTDQIVTSELVPNTNCRCDHAGRWQNVERLQMGPSSMRLVDMIPCRGNRDLRQTQLRFCQNVALRGRCEVCGYETFGVRWISDLDAPMSVCRECGDRVRAIPFWTYSQINADRLRPVLDLPLAEWGVAEHAVLEITRDDRTRTYVVGGERTTDCQSVRSQPQ